MRAPKIAFVLCLLALSVFPAPSYAEAPIDNGLSQTYVLSYEAYSQGAAPCSLSADSWCAITTVGSASGSSFVATTGGGSPTGSSSWQVSDGGAAYAAQMANNGANVDVCQSGQSFTHDFNAPNIASSLTTIDYRVASAAVVVTAEPANTIGIAVTRATTTTDTVRYFVRGNTAATATFGTPFTINGGTTHTIRIAQVTCTPSMKATFTMDGGNAQTVTLADTVSGALNKYAVAITGSVSLGASVYSDNYNWSGVGHPAPTITALTPNVGTSGGGTSVSVTGTGFYSVGTNKPSVTFGGNPANNVQVISSTQLLVSTPLHANGIVNVTVANPDGKSATLANGFTYGTLCPGTNQILGFENYDSQSVGQRPAACWYTQAGLQGVTPDATQGLIVATQAVSPPNADLYAQSGTTRGVFYNFTGVSDLCPASATARHFMVQLDFIIPSITPNSNAAQGAAIGLLNAKNSNGFEYPLNGAGYADEEGAAILIGSDGVVRKWAMNEPAGSGSAAVPTTGTLGSGFVFGQAYRLAIAPDCFDETTASNALTVNFTLTNLVSNVVIAGQVACTSTCGGSINPHHALNYLALAWTRAGVENSGGQPAFNLYHDNLYIPGLASPPASQIPVTGLSGFQVVREKDFGAPIILIVRQNQTGTGSFVYTYSPNDLQYIAHSPQTNCIRGDGVGGFSQGGVTNIEYTQCDSGSHDATNVYIKNQNFGNPNTDNCNGSNQCDGNIVTPGFVCSSASGFVLPTALRESRGMNQLGSVLFDRSDDSGFNENLVTFGYDVSPGTEFGVVAYDFINNNCDGGAVKKLDIGGPSNTQVSEICVLPNPFKQDTSAGNTQANETIIGSGAGATTIGDRINSHITANNDPAISAQPWFTSAANTIGGALTSIACHNRADNPGASPQNLTVGQYVLGSHYVTATQSQVAYFRVGPTKPGSLTALWAMSLNTPARGLAVAQKKELVAIAESDRIQVFNVEQPSNPLLVCEENLPGGTWKGMDFDGLGQNLFVFTSSFITRYDTTGCEPRPGQAGYITGDGTFDPTQSGDGSTDCDSNGVADNVQDPMPACAASNAADSTDTIPGAFGKPTFPGINVPQTAKQLGMNATATGGIICLMWILIVAAGLYAVNDKLGLLGGILALGTCFLFGLLPLWWAVLMFAAVIGLFFALRRFGGV